MSLNFDDDVTRAIQVAKESVPEGELLAVQHVLTALFHHTEMKEQFPQLKEHLPSMEKQREADKISTADDLQDVLRPFVSRDESIKPDELFRALVTSSAGQAYLLKQGIALDALHEMLGRFGGDQDESTPWRESAQRQQLINQLEQYGKMLTAQDLPPRNLVGREESLKMILAGLCGRKHRSSIITGFPGTGKTALIYELARMLKAGDPSIPAPIRDLDIFEMVPTLLRAGASVVGEYEERLKGLIRLLQDNPNVVLFVDEVHSWLESGMHHSGPFSQAAQSLKGPIARGEITLIGCTTLAEFRHFIEPDPALVERFAIVELPPMNSAAALGVLKKRQAVIERHYGLKIPETLLERVVALTDDYMPGHYQPRKSLHLLEEACAYHLVESPDVSQLTEEDIITRLEGRIGQSVIRQRTLTVDDVFTELTATLKGQDQVLREISEQFVGGWGEFKSQEEPRGVWLFGGPTGVGKTETARRLARVLGGDHEAWIRVDCNTLQGSGFDGGPAVNRLLGVPPGYVGYARGEGGLLSRIRDTPECVVLFDEFEKADPSVGQLLLQIIDKGRVDDTEGNKLDFRRAFLVFTTNAGCTYETQPEFGFLSGQDAVENPHVDLSNLRREFRAMGLGEEFLARMHSVFLFNSLDTDAIRQIVNLKLESLCREAKEHGLKLDWAPELPEVMVQRCSPRHGARPTTNQLRNRVIAQLNIAQVEGQMDQIERVFLSLERPLPEENARYAPMRHLENGTLTIYLGDEE